MLLINNAKISTLLIMSKESIPYESQLYSVWKKQNFKSTLKTYSGDKIEVLDAGTENNDCSRPDFKHARVRIGNLVFVGDIEIDPTYQDWKSHGHHIDKKYNKVILHAAFQNNANHGYVYTREGRKIPSGCLANFIDDSTIQFAPRGVRSKPGASKKQFLRCESYSEEISRENIKKTLSKLGIERIQKKANRIFNRMCELLYIKELHLKEPIINYELTPEFKNRNFQHSDFQDKAIWRQVFYEFIFEALGYSKNKSPMLKLAQPVQRDYLQRTSTEDPLFSIETSLFNVAGLVPAVTEYNESKLSEYVKKLSERWKLLSKIYDGKLYDETDWQVFRLSPHNFPTIRIAGGAVLIDQINKNLIEAIIRKVKEIRNLRVLTNSLRSLFVVRGRGYWRKHYVFEDSADTEIKYFVGISRADEIVINVLIPFLLIYFDVFGQTNLSKRIFQVYHTYVQHAENKIVHNVAEALDVVDLLRRTIYTQGMLELYRNSCSKNKCGECDIGDVVYN